MKKKSTVFLSMIMMVLLAAGCAGIPAAAPQAAAGADAIQDGPAAEESGPQFFTKGVYANYAKEAEEPSRTYFYVFTADDYGYTADGEKEGIGLPFDTEQTESSVKFFFGGADESEDVFIVTGTENGCVYGYFEDTPERELVFEPVEGVDAETFSAENYVNGPENSVYRDANGWSIRYDASKFEIHQDGPQVFIVYTGDSAGTNMITVTYTVENRGEAAIKALGEPYGDKAVYSETPFPGAEDVTGYRVSVPVDTEGSGTYMEAVGRDFMDGALIFELDGHQGDDEEMNMAVGDALADVIDSLTFE